MNENEFSRDVNFSVSLFMGQSLIPPIISSFLNSEVNNKRLVQRQCRQSFTYFNSKSRAMDNRHTKEHNSLNYNCCSCDFLLGSFSSAEKQKAKNSGRKLSEQYTKKRGKGDLRLQSPLLVKCEVWVLKYIFYAFNFRTLIISFLLITLTRKVSLKSSSEFAILKRKRGF